MIWKLWADYTTHPTTKCLAYSCPCFPGFLFLFSGYILHGYSSDDENEMPTMVNSELDVEIVYNGVEQPTSMTFIGPDDILVLEKDTS